MRSLIDKLLKKNTALPTMPAIVARLAELLYDDSAGAADFEQIIRPDASLTASLLRLANSAYFGTRREIGSVRQAIAFLGTDRVFELATSAWLSHTLPKRIPGYGISAKSLWLHSLATGVFNEQLALAARIRPPEMAFTAGLLHDIGKLVVGTLLETEVDVFSNPACLSDTIYIHTERELLGVDHAEVGAMLCEKWQLPLTLEWAARWHHTPSEAPETVDQVLVDLTHLSDSLAHTLGFGADVGGELSRMVENDVLDRLLLDNLTIEKAINNDVVNHIWEIGEMVAGGISC